MKIKKRNQDDLYELISYNIKKSRLSKNMTQKELSIKSKYSHEFIRRIESRKTKKYFSIDTIGNIANALEIDIVSLFKKDQK